MVWVYLDDQFPDHPKVVAAGDAAAWLFVCGLAYCKRYSTAGRIPKAVVPKLTSHRQPTKLAGRLVDVRLWIDRGDHYDVHDYDQWNRSQQSRSDAGRKAAQARWGRDAKRNADVSETQTESDSDPPADAVRNPMPQDAQSLSLTHRNQGGENSRTAPLQAAPPSRKCPAHQHIDHPPKCGDCADARRAHDAWQRQHAPPPAKPPELTEQERTQRAQLAHAEASAARVRELAQEPPDPNAAEHARQLRDSLRPHQENQ